MRFKKTHKSLLLVAGLFASALLYYVLIVSPVLSKQKSLQTYIAKKEADLVEMRALKMRWEEFQRTRAEAEKMLSDKGEKTFTLLSFLEDILRKVGVDKKIQYMKPLSLPDEGGVVKPEGIEIKLDDINTRELVTFLQSIEGSGKLMEIKRIKIQKASKVKTALLKVTIQVYTYTLIGQKGVIRSSRRPGVMNQREDFES